MPKYLTIGYGDEDGYRATDPSLRDQAHAHDAWLVSQGAVCGRAGKPVQVRNTDGTGVRTDEGPFLRANLPIAGFALIEAADLEAAIASVANTPCAIAHGVVEVWPLIIREPAR
jgi:hypothetical protein